MLKGVYDPAEKVTRKRFCDPSRGGRGQIFLSLTLSHSRPRDVMACDRTTAKGGERRRTGRGEGGDERRGRFKEREGEGGGNLMTRKGGQRGKRILLVDGSRRLHHARRLRSGEERRHSLSEILLSTWQQGSRRSAREEPGRVSLFPFFHSY